MCSNLDGYKWCSYSLYIFPFTTINSKTKIDNNKHEKLRQQQQPNKVEKKKKKQKYSRTKQL